MSRSRLIAVFVSLVAMMSMAIAGAAQDATPAASIAHPAHVHVGPCAELDPNPTYPLDNVVPVAEGGIVDTSTTTIDASLDELLASPFAINAHLSGEDVATYIACGDIAGPVVDGQLLIGMIEQNDSGHSGVAVLQSNDAGGTDVTVYLVYTGEE